MRKLTATILTSILLFIIASSLAAQEVSLEIKAFFTNRASTTALADDPELTITVPAGKYTVESFLFITAGSAGGFSVQVGGTAIRQQQAIEYSANEYNIFGTFISSKPPALLVPYTVSGNSIYFVRVTGGVIISTGGTYTIKWAQATSSTTNTTLSAGSYLRLIRKVP